MGLLSALFSGPSKSQIDFKILQCQREIANAKTMLAGMSAKMKREQPGNVASIKSFIEHKKIEIDSLKAQRKNAK